MIKRFHLLLPSVLLLASCQPPPTTPPPPQVDRVEQRQVLSMSYQAGQAVTQSGPRDAQRAVLILFQLEVYRLSLPMGSISRNEAFWKRIDEHAVDVATYDLLYRNGVRIGRAPYSEWGHFRKMIENTPGTASHMSTAGVNAKNIEMEMRRAVAAQDIFYFDSRNESVGRTHFHSANIISISFQPAPRKPGEVRLALCPVVRSLRKRLEFTRLNEEQEIQYVANERLYDLNIETDLPLEHFLVIAPSEEATWKTSIGQRFFVLDDAAEQMEQVLLVLAQPYRLDEPEPARRRR
jgi:hypothetical protein